MRHVLSFIWRTLGRSFTLCDQALKHHQPIKLISVAACQQRRDEESTLDEKIKHLRKLLLIKKWTTAGVPLECIRELLQDEDEKEPERVVDSI
jgi:hypothetical protein